MVNTYMLIALRCIHTVRQGLAEHDGDCCIGNNSRLSACEAFVPLYLFSPRRDNSKGDTIDISYPV